MTKKLSDIEQEAKLRKQTFYDPTLDPVFKKVFRKKSTLIHFLNTFLHLENESKITSVEQLLRTVKLDNQDGNAIGRFDIHARTADGQFVNIEMQRVDDDDLMDRIELYGCLLALKAKITMDGEASKKELENHPYLMPTVYSIWLCNFPVPFCKGYREDLGLFRHSDLGDKHALPIYAKKRYIIIDITKFVPSGKNDLEEQWLEIFKNAPKAKRIPPNVSAEIRDVYERLMVKNSTEDFFKKVVSSMKDKRDYWAGLATAHRRGEAEERSRNEAANAARDKKIAEYLRANGVSAKLLNAALAIK
jgi:predicted transposase/invertase (TIGR01784 family)